MTPADGGHAMASVAFLGADMTDNPFADVALYMRGFQISRMINVVPSCCAHDRAHSLRRAAPEASAPVAAFSEFTKALREPGSFRRCIRVRNRAGSHRKASPPSQTRQPSDTDAAPAARTFCPPESRIFVLVAAILASSMGFIDGSVISIATPAIRADLGASLADAQWVSNAYMLFLASLLLIGGAAGDRFGLRNVFAIGIVLFVVASLVCAIAPTPLLLILARAVQGIGAAIMVPGSLAIIAKAYPREERGKAIGVWAAASSLTTILGPDHRRLRADGARRLELAAGLRHQPAARRHCAGAAVARACPADTPDEGRRLDIVGGMLVTAALLLLALGLTGDDSVPELGRALLLCGIAVVLIIAFLIWESADEVADAAAAAVLQPLRFRAPTG